MNTKSSDNESIQTESEEEEIEFTDDDHEGKNFTLNLSFKIIRVFIYFYETFLNII